MDQHINNPGPVENQVIAAAIHGDIYLAKKSRFSKRFEKLNKEVGANARYEEVLEDFKYYITKLDGIDMPTKLADGGFTEKEIIEATRKKERYAKKLEKNKFFESAQWIDSQLFAKIKIDFETYVLVPLINAGASRDLIMMTVLERVINPVLEIINTEGQDDEILNYNAEDIFGMVYYLTGMCHLNWKDYDNL
jgi:hypothetical protein